MKTLLYLFMCGSIIRGPASPKLVRKQDVDAAGMAIVGEGLGAQVLPWDTWPDVARQEHKSKRVSLIWPPLACCATRALTSPMHGKWPCCIFISFSTKLDFPKWER